MEDEFRELADVGIVIQCYLRDAENDVLALRDWARRRGTPVWVRLVKGAYWDLRNRPCTGDGVADSGVSAEMAVGRQFRANHAVPDAQSRALADRAGEPQRPLAGARNCHGRASRLAA